MLVSADLETWKVILQAVTALVGVVGIGWTIIWAIRGPRLRISLLDSRGYPTRYGDSQEAPPAFFYHLRVRNIRKWTANHVRVKITKLTKKYKGQVNWEQRTPVCLVWATLPSPKLYLLDVLGLDEEACNLGFIIKGRSFQLDAMDPARVGQNEKWPPGFQGFLHADETMRLELVAVAENARSNTLYLEITWDGQWHDQPEEMQKHLVLSTIRPGTLASVRSRLGFGSPGA
jgi:hypothetical protein